MPHVLLSDWIYRFAARLREADPDVSPRQAVSLACAAAGSNRWQEHSPEDIATRAFDTLRRDFGIPSVAETAPAIFGLL